MSAEQASFTNAILDAGHPVPPGLTDAHGGPAGKRFDVYRNNVVVSLTEALETGFPILRKLVGDVFFKAMAGAFVRAHPPEHPRLQLYGQRLPGFLASFPPVAHLPYLPDIARLELGLRQSYHAADAKPLSVQGRDPNEVLTLKPRVAPATLVVQSRYPIFAIWRANTAADAPKAAGGGQDILITRPGFDPAPHLLPPGGVAFARLLKGRISLAEAMAATLADTPTADISALLSLFISTGALTLERKDP
ncbi:DUF2063 domain-containing protein [Rhodophyticola sp. CCM32]|uniref:HvfC/BufC N-terminal domain-containing protein n=1 Tax=Rhodophyticola sp. CCM32 TaxID=2916397 RepID=UPI00107EFD3E|nr:DNA-binding domain-containing protein [Rhodophyticola sp. CCM32]QBX99564.1 DUF2063 domain-containing protein [Rhodophyticola sp. CCM32]